MIKLPIPWMKTMRLIKFPIIWAETIGPTWWRLPHKDISLISSFMHFSSSPVSTKGWKNCLILWRRNGLHKVSLFQYSLTVYPLQLMVITAFIFLYFFSEWFFTNTWVRKFMKFFTTFQVIRLTHEPSLARLHLSGKCIPIHLVPFHEQSAESFCIWPNGPFMTWISPKIHKSWFSVSKARWRGHKETYDF